MSLSRQSEPCSNLVVIQDRSQWQRTWHSVSLAQRHWQRTVHFQNRSWWGVTLQQFVSDASNSKTTLNNFFCYLLPSVEHKLDCVGTFRFDRRLIYVIFFTTASCACKLITVMCCCAASRDSPDPANLLKNNIYTIHNEGRIHITLGDIIW